MKIAAICILEPKSSFVQQSIQCFQNQTFENKELWVMYRNNDEKSIEIAKKYDTDNHILLKEVANGVSHIWLQEYTSKADSNLFFVEVQAIHFANKGKIRNLANALTSAEYFCTWSPNAFHAADRMEKQFNFTTFVDKPANVLANVTVYNQLNSLASISLPREYGFIETLFAKKDTLVFPDLETGEEFEVQNTLFNYNKISVLDEPALYTQIGDFDTDTLFFKTYSAEESEEIRKKLGTKKVYDGVLSLGAWCQVGAAIRNHQLTFINSPIHNFGIKNWANIIDILEDRFDGYWERENMAIGKTDFQYSAQYNDERDVYKVYCNKYNMISNHHFDACDNTAEELKTFDAFKEKIDLLSEIFLVQCREYERVLFCLKVMSAPEVTTISKEEILRLVKVLNELREGKAYDLKMSVPEANLAEVQAWIAEENLSQVSVCPWNIEWNNDKDDIEWQFMLGDAQLAENYFPRLNTEIIGLEEVSYTHIHYLNS